VEIGTAAERAWPGLRASGQWSRKQSGQMSWDICPWVAERLKESLNAGTQGTYPHVPAIVVSARRSPFEGERAVACVQQCENLRKRRSNDDDVQPLSRTAYCLLLASLSVDGDLSSPFETEICVPIHTFYLACDRDGVATRPQVITNLVHLRYGRIRTPGVAL